MHALLAYHCFGQLKENLAEQRIDSRTEFDATIDVVEGGIEIILRMIDALQGTHGSSSIDSRQGKGERGLTIIWNMLRQCQ